MIYKKDFRFWAEVLFDVRNKIKSGVGNAVPGVPQVQSTCIPHRVAAFGGRNAEDGVPYGVICGNQRLMSKFWFMISLMALSSSVMLASPWMVCLMTEEATAKLIRSMGL